MNRVPASPSPTSVRAEPGMRGLVGRATPQPLHVGGDTRRRIESQQDDKEIERSPEDDVGGGEVFTERPAVLRRH